MFLSMSLFLLLRLLSTLQMELKMQEQMVMGSRSMKHTQSVSMGLMGVRSPQATPLSSQMAKQKEQVYCVKNDQRQMLGQAEEPKSHSSEGGQEAVYRSWRSRQKKKDPMTWQSRARRNTFLTNWQTSSAANDPQRLSSRSKCTSFIIFTNTKKLKAGLQVALVLQTVCSTLTIRLLKSIQKYTDSAYQRIIVGRNDTTTPLFIKHVLQDTRMSTSRRGGNMQSRRRLVPETKSYYRQNEVCANDYEQEERPKQHSGRNRVEHIGRGSHCNYYNQQLQQHTQITSNYHRHDGTIPLRNGTRECLLVYIAINITMDDISSPLSRIQRKNTTQNELEHTFSQLNAFIEEVSKKIKNRIQLVQHVYLEDYSAQVQEMTQELRSLREVLDEELLRERSNERLFYLEEERDFFRGQVLKLTSELNLQKNANQALRKHLEEKEVERLNYHQIAFDLQKKAHKAVDAAQEMRKVRQEPTSNPFSKLEPTDTHYTSTALTSKALPSTALTSGAPTSQQLPSNFLKRKELDRGIGVGVRSSSLQLIKKVSWKEGDRKEQILSSCIKEIKKQIFYRNLPLRQTGQIHFGEEERVGLERFTRGDKLGLLEKLLSNSEMVDLFQEFLAGHRKVVDAHQSTLLLNRQKTKFANKIYNAKHTL